MPIAEEVSLYLVSPDTIANVADFTASLEKALQAGGARIGAVLLCDAGAAQAVQPLCAEYGVAFLINDDVALAANLQADGVHLANAIHPLKDVRAQLGKDAVIGVSCFASRDRALRMGEAGADYVSFGPFYTTGDATPASMELLGWWQEYLTLPVVALGGVTPERAGDLVKAGADMLGVDAEVWQADGAMESFEKAITEALQSA